MYCLNCGTAIPEGSAFCVACGARVDNAPSVPQPTQANPPVTNQQPYGQQPYGQQPYGQYGPPPGGQPPKSGKPKTWLFIAGGAVLLIAIALVLIFVVFKVGGDKTGGDGLLTSGTMQAEFVNDGTEVFANAFAGLGGVDYTRMGSEPFDVEMEYSIDMSGFPMTLSLAAAYDEEDLGVAADVMGQSVVVLLDEDTLYTSMYGMVTGYQFESDADLSEPMTLEKRLKALTEALASSSGADTMLVIEAAVNSISADCFDKSGAETTLKMTNEDVIDMLNTLAEKAEKDDELSDALDEMELDIDDAIENMEDSDIELVITVGYVNKVPASIEISYDDGSDYGSFNLMFAYETTDDGKEITLKAEAAGQEINGTFSMVKDGDEVQYEGEVDAGYSGTYSIEGSESWDGDKVEGAMTVEGGGASYEISYEGTVSFAMPDKVEDDSRFEIDKDSADIQDIEDLMSGGYIDYPMPSEYPSAEVSWPAETEAPSYASGSGTIGLILPTVDTSYYTTLAENIASEASYYGWETSIYTTDYTYLAEITMIQQAVAAGCTAVIVDPFALADSDIQQIESLCNGMGIPCSLILDEGETASGNVGAVWCDLSYAGSDMAFLCDYGNVFLIGNEYGSDGSYYVEQSLLYDTDYGIADYEDIFLVGSAYVSYDPASVYEAVDQALANYTIDSFVCTDRILSYYVFEELESQGYTGSLLCYTYETTMNETYPVAYNTYVTYEYFAISDIAYDAVMAIADQTQYGLSPQVYTVYSSSY